MTARQHGIGRRPGKKRAPHKLGAQQPCKASARDEAAAERAAEAMLGMGSPAPAAAGPSTPVTQPPAAPGGVRDLREQLAASHAEAEHANKLRNDANRRARAAEGEAKRAKALAATRLKERDDACGSQRAWREELHECEDEMQGLASEAIVADLPAVGRARRGKGGGKGEAPWPMWMVQLILEQLVNGTPPSAIPANILSQDRLMTGRDGQQPPSVGFCRDMRVVLRILTETLAAYQLAKQGQWKQLFSDGMRWDADAARKEEVSESAFRLLRSKWNPKGVQGEGAWRFDL
mmetsp:Transcript_3886/g.10150  ORF Transcript_3886/g.10150 Transcript_3886/m.10150 type:complete len:291 (+) Transcript_3886:4227-5099(+)